MIQATRAPAAPLYSSHPPAADRGQWSITSDVRWGDIDVQRAHRQPEVLRAVRRAARELSARGADVARLLPAAICDVHASALLILELHDGLKHLHALRTYLDTVEFAPALTDEELAEARGVANHFAPPSGDCTAALVTCLAIEHVASAHIRHLCARTDEPVLAELLSFIAADEARHARIVSELIALYITADPDTAALVRRRAEQLRDDAKQGCGVGAWTRDDVAMQAFMNHVEALTGYAARSDPTPRAVPSP